MNKIMKKNKGEFIVFLLTICILLLVFKLDAILDHTIIISDLRNEFYPLYTHLSRMLKNDIGLYSFNLSMGDSFLGTLYFYMTSPFNLLLWIIKDINLFCIITIILKSAFSSVFCYKYLKYQFKTEKSLYYIIFSLLYALSSYYLSYNMHVEFLDIYMLFPLLLLGIDKIIKEKNYILYIVSFMLIIFCNYYFAYMIAIFSFLYFNYKTLMKKIKRNDLIQKNMKFILISFLICLSMSFVLLPIISEIGLYSRGPMELFGGEAFEIIFDLQDIVNYYIMGNLIDITILNPWHFYLYTSIIVFPLLYLYFINKKFSKREKILTSIILIILILSISCNYINYMWHGFTPPFAINGRFTFLFILFILMICTKSLYYLKEFNNKHYMIIFSIIYFIFTFYTIIYYPRMIDIEIIIRVFLIYFITVSAALFLKKNPLSWKQYIVSITTIILLLMVLSSIIKPFSYTIVIKGCLVIICIIALKYLLNNRNIQLKHFLLFFLILLIPISIYSFWENIRIIESVSIIKLLILLLLILILKYIPKKKWAKGLLLVVILIELVINDYGYLYRFPYQNDVDNSYQEAIDFIKEKDQSVYYRIEDNYRGIPKNDPILYNYNGIDYFVSTIKQDLVNFFVDLNVKSNQYNYNSIQYDGSYYLLSSLLNIKYYVETRQKENNIYTQIGEIGKYDIYQNEDSLELGYIVDKDIINIYKRGNGLDYINQIYKTMTKNDKNVLEEINSIQENETNYSFLNTTNNDIYLLIEVESLIYDAQIDVYINNEVSNGIYNEMVYKIKNDYELNEPIQIKTNNKIKNIHMYYIQNDVYKEDIEILKENQLQVTKISKNKLEGTIDAKKDGILFISCLYNKDLDVYVDGVKQDKIKILNAMLGTEIKKGKHQIVLQYKPHILYISIIPSFIGWILLMVVLKRQKR